MVRQAPIHLWSMRLLTIAVSFIGCTAWVKQSMITALQLPIGPPIAAPAAHIHLCNAVTPATLTSHSLWDAEHAARDVANVKCAADSQLLCRDDLQPVQNPVLKTGVDNRDGSGVITGIQRCWCAQRYARATGDWNCAVGCVSVQAEPRSSAAQRCVPARLAKEKG